MTDPIRIESKGEHEYELQNLPHNDGVWIRVENFDLQIMRTDEGIVVDIYAYTDMDRGESLASTYAFDADTDNNEET